MHLYLLLVAFIGGFIVSIYPKYAPKKGWRVSRSLRAHGGAAASAGFASMAGAAIFIVARADWWLVAVLIAVGVAVGMTMVHVMKSTVQPVALALIAFGWLWFVLLELRW